VIKVRSELAGPKEFQRFVESWQAPALGCFALRELFYMGKPGEPFQLVNLREAKAISLGEPERVTFAIPGSYFERAPLDVISEFGRRYPDKIDCENCSRIDDSNRAYFNANEVR
jgi:hypothetical protein